MGWTTLARFAKPGHAGHRTSSPAKKRRQVGPRSERWPSCVLCIDPPGRSSAAVEEMVAAA